MNRTLLFPFDGASPNGATLSSSQLVPPQNTTDWFERQEFTSPVQRSSTPTVYRCFAPVHYEPGYSYPLIVWLHGPQSNEDELRQVMPHISLRNHIAIAPQGTQQMKGFRRAFRWGDSAEDLAEAGERVQNCVSIAQDRYNIHPKRIFVAGHCEGGTLAHRLGMEFPELFAGAISLGGRVPRGSRLLKNINRARQLPLLLSVSPSQENRSGQYSTEQVLEDLRFLHCAGLSLSLRLYPKSDGPKSDGPKSDGPKSDGPKEDGLTTVMFSDLNNWVMEQFCTTGAEATS